MHLVLTSSPQTELQPQPMLDDAIAADDGRPFPSHWDDGDASGSGIFDDDDMADNAEEDGFNLLTQSNDLFKQDHATSDSDSDNGEGSDDSSSSSSGSSSCSSSSSEEDIKGESLEQLRAKNIRRNEAFANKLKLEMHAMLGKDEANLIKNRRLQQQKRQAREVLDPTKSLSPAIHKQDKRRGMIFATKSNGMLYQEGVQQLRQPTLAQELNEKYPHRSKQIYYLCARLQSIVSRTEMAWKMNENVRSYGESNYSEASYSGRVKMSAPSPILISGAGGTGKTSIVCDAIQSLRERTNSSGGGLSRYRIVSNAYVDCASAESNSVTSVMNNAYKQLYECYHSNDSAVSRKKSHRKRTRTVGRDVKTSEIGTKSISGRLSQADHSIDGVNDIDYDDSDNDYDDDGDFDEEDLIERQRKRRGVVKKRNKRLTSVAGADKSSTGHTRQTRQSIAQQNSDQSAVVAANQSIALKHPVYTQESSAVAIFGRAISSILQGDTSKKRAPQNGRCAFFILDNADRILSWNKSRRNNPLAELLLLPKIMGINLTLILISRSTLYQYSRVQKPPGTILDAVQPNQIYFDAYSSVDIIKDIMRLPRIQHMVTGRANLTRHKHECVVSNLVRARFEQLCYSSLLGWSISSVKGSTHDLTEIIRLSRFLWPEYVAPLDGSAGSIDPKFKAPLWQVLCYLKSDVGESSVSCDCSSRVCIASAVDTGRVGVDFAVLKQRLFEKLDNSIRETMRDFLSTAVLMPSRVLRHQISKPYAERLPYVTKFLLLAAFLCQNKKAESDKNLFTKRNTGKSRRSANKTDLGSSYASSSTELKQLTVRQPSFPIERLLSVFYSIMGSYGQHSMQQNGGSTNDVSAMGSERLFRSISQLSATGLIRRVGRSNISLGKTKDVTEMTSAKFSCSLSREDADLIAKSVGFPLDKYCP